MRGARLYVLCSLVFFLMAMLGACTPSPGKVELIWKNNRATGIQIPKQRVDNKDKLTVKLAGKATTILGDVSDAGDAFVFTPVIPLSPRLTYLISDDGKLIGAVTVPADQSEKPKLFAIHPQSDTLPENTLKLYLQFSKPMRSGRALDHVYLLDKNRDTMRNVFLDLQPELWDSTGTILTLWLDPGRIKRDLVLNRQLGNPLKKSQHYELVVSGDWKDTHGKALDTLIVKKFTVGPRVDETIDISKWQLTVSKAGTTNMLVINTGRSLDHYLLQESVWITDVNGKPLDGMSSMTGSDHDRILKFRPDTKWQARTYKIKVNTRLEDLAGNNLNKVFDRDIYKQAKKDDAFAFREFEVKP